MVVEPPTTPAHAYLVPLSGPPLKAIDVTAKEGGVLVGRHENCDVRLTPETVSRYHARLWLDDGRWHLVDLKSRWGTFLNGCRLAADRDVVLRDGDLVRITPWTFSFSTTGQKPTSVDSYDDRERMQTLVRAVAPTPREPLTDNLLALLLESAAGMHAAEDEQSLAAMLLDAALRGTGLANATLLRPVDAAGRVEVIASRGAAAEKGEVPYSRSLLAAASAGVVAELAGGASDSESICQFSIQTAICVPLMLGATVAGYLYVDARGPEQSPRRLHPNATAFCSAIGRMASLALANMKRIDVERRQAALEAEVEAGVAAQKWVLPPRVGQVGQFVYVGESRPGRYMAGDFFDVIPLDEDRVAVALGDVAGKGIGASVLMTAAQGFLHAALKAHREPGTAMAELNRFICSRSPQGKFITLWLGVFDAAARRLRYVDAGHGYALMQDDAGAVRTLPGEGMPVGIEESARYVPCEAPFNPGARALIISDGIIEQFDVPAGADAAPRCFGMDGVERHLCESPAGVDEVAGLFSAVIRHGGGAHLADDATAVIVRWATRAP